MALERTFSIVKPDATKRNLVGQIVAKFEEGGLRVVAQKRIQLTLAQAQQFYGVHSERPFFGELCEFMISEPIVVQVLEGENAILRNREIMGATNPSEAEEGTIRKEFALSIGENSVHGSDAPETAAEEIEKHKTYQAAQRHYRGKDHGKPSKKDRRELDDFLEGW